MILPIVGRVQVRRGQMMVDDMFSVSKGWLIAKEGQQMRKKCTVMRHTYVMSNPLLDGVASSCDAP